MCKKWGKIHKYVLYIINVDSPPKNPDMTIFCGFATRNIKSGVLNNLLSFDTNYLPLSYTTQSKIAVPLNGKYLPEKKEAKKLAYRKTNMIKEN